MQHAEYLALFNLQQIKFNVLQLNRMIYAVRPTQSRQPFDNCRTNYAKLNARENAENVVESAVSAGRGKGQLKWTLEIALCRELRSRVGKSK